MANKTELKNVENKIPDSNVFVKKTDYGSEITKIKYDYVTNASLTSQLNDLKSQHIADEVKKVDDKFTKNSSNILGFESRLKEKENLTNEFFLEEIIMLSNKVIYYTSQKHFLLNILLVV